MNERLVIALLATIGCLSTTVLATAWNPFQQDEYYQTGRGNEPFASGGLQPSYQNGAAVPATDQCSAYKVGFTQDLYFQYIQYKTEIPEMKQFTLCFWTKFYNHSNDHPIFSYAVDGQPKAITSWVSNTDRSSYFSMAVEGHTFFRLNYPLRLNRWYHTCQSWNGKTGEWQIWVNAERVGRGFHNRLVGHTIQGGGIAISGQEQSQLGGGFQEGKEAPKGAGGMLGEITMLQLYKVALTAGKAHKDHKHHHAHQFDHNGRAITTPAPTTPRNRPTLPSHPLLTGGQINPNVKINVAAIQQQPQIVPGQNYDAQLLNGQFVQNLLTQQLSQSQQPQQPADPQAPVLFIPQAQQQSQQQQQPLSSPSQLGSVSSQFLSIGDTPLLNTDFNHVQLSSIERHNLYKRNNKDEESANEPKFGDKITKAVEATSDKKKRELFIAGGTLFDDSYPPQTGSNFDQSLLYGLAGVGENNAISLKQKQQDEREPAEAEVKAVMNICNSCDEEPFDKALIFGWRTVPKKLYAGAFYTPAVAECKVF